MICDDLIALKAMECTCVYFGVLNLSVLARKQKCVCVCMYICVCVCVCVCIYIYIYTHTHTYVCMYKYIHIHTIFYKSSLESSKIFKRIKGRGEEEKI